METKMPLFFSIVLIFLPLLLFADNTGLYLTISYIILFILSLDSIVVLLKYSKDKSFSEELDKLRSEFESASPFNFRKLALGFKTAKLIFIATFVITVLLSLSTNSVILALSVLVLFLSVVELRNYRSSRLRLFSFFSGTANMLFLISLAVTKYLL